MNTKDLQGAALDWAVATIEFPEPDYCDDDRTVYVTVELDDGPGTFSPSTNWAQGGPIIEREKIDCVADPNGKDVWMGQLYATRLSGEKVIRAYGPTPLIAAMRTFVSKTFPNGITTPEELAK